GGIVWCLTIEAPGALPILDSPSHYGLIPGRWWENPSDTLFYDDDISTEEMNLI
ncbi:hypothetical protein K439DRAFT_1348932, partial [Ramaria rubella]